MPLFEPAERSVMEAVATLTSGNPFLPERVAAEQEALGEEFVATTAVWHVEADLNGLNPNVPRISERVEALGASLRRRLVEGCSATPRELELYQILTFYLIYQRYAERWMDLIRQAPLGRGGKVRCWDEFAADVAHFFELPEREFPVSTDPAFLFALGFQLRRAFHHTFRRIYGGSMPAARLRAAVWRSIFTHDFRRYLRGLHRRLGDVPTLIVGESGTGKELAARAIGLSRFVPFDPDTRSFASNFAQSFHPLNLSAFSRPLIESELFGHKRGAFTGALEDRKGWLESCGAEGAVFLDEIGELAADVQVKLLRVLQSRSFQRVGETGERRFEGKILAATNRDLAAEMAAGRFRADFYYRLCADVVRTPTLREQLAGEPEELRNLVVVLARRLVDPEEVEVLADETVSWVETELGAEYSWPGNVRELEQCVRSVLVRGEYRPAAPPRPDGAEDLVAQLREGELSADELLRRYCTEVYARVGSYEEAARRLGLDRRTVKARIDAELLERLRGEAPDS